VCPGGAFIPAEAGVARIEGTGLPGRSDKLLNPVPNADAPAIESTKVYQK